MARKKWSAEEKQKMGLAGMRNETSATELCRQYGASDGMDYKWGKAFLEGGHSGLKGNGKTGDHESALKRENEELKALIGELTVENRFLKKIQGS